MPLIGAHVGTTDPLRAAEAIGADAVQMFVSNPQSWRAPKPRDDADEIRASGLPLYIHAPYLVNVASANNRIRIPSRKILTDSCDAAAQLGAVAVITHGGHVTDDETPEAGFSRWKKALEVVTCEVSIFIENTAGGKNAMSREIDVIGRLWEEIGDLGPGFVLDTCHAWSAGEPFSDLVERVLAATGRIDLVHCNDSRDSFGSGRDRHANLGQGEIPPDDLLAVVTAAGAPVIIETPDGVDAHKADIDWLRSRLSSR